MSSRLKRKNKRNNAPPCIYCEERPGITEDHVVFLGLFADPKPPNKDLILVPACKECNEARLARHQDYLRDLLITDFRCAEHPTARAVFAGPATRSMRSRRSDVAKVVWAGTELEPVHTPGGIYLGHAHRIPAEDWRTTYVLRMMAKGLYFHATGSRLSKDYTIDVNYPDPGSPFVVSESWDAFMKMGVKTVFELPQGVFRGLLTYADDDPNIASWLFIFYGGFPVLLYSHPTS